MNAPAQERTALGLPLASGGTTLIEASAGTGKTYALTTLVARLLVEEPSAGEREGGPRKGLAPRKKEPSAGEREGGPRKGLAPRKKEPSAGEREGFAPRKKEPLEIGALLVVTFTNAATDELRDKIRHTLRAAVRMAAGDAGRQDAQARELLAHWDALGIDREDVVGRLEVAIADLDRANVLTIHGFCQRVLTDFAFDCGLSFGFEVTGDGFDVVRAVVRDHSRRVLYPAPSVRVRYAMERKFLPEELADWVAGKVAKRDLEIRGAERLDAAARALLEDREEAWRTALEDAHAAWGVAGGVGDADTELESVGAMLDQAEGVLAGRRGEDLGAAELADTLDARYVTLRECLKRLDRAGTALREAYEDWLPRARREVLEEAREAIDRRVREDRLLGYDDLLTVVQRAVEASPELAARLRERFPCALIDEYQDTDRVQADIFERIYPSEGKSKSDGANGGTGRMFIVGDPKQSIYRFRSADIFAYLGASSRVGQEERLRLGRNYRSVPELTEAVNALFRRPRPFVLPDIDLEPVASAFPANAPRLVVEGEEDVAPLQFRILPGRGPKKPTKGDATTTAAARAAGEIARLLALGAEGRARIGDQPLTGGDIAVLVRKTDQGRTIAEKLRGHGIRSVEIGDADVFESREADQLERLLWAISKPQSPDRIRGALAGDLFSLDAGELARLVDDDEAWNVWKERLEAWRGIWEAQGVATAIRRLMWDFDASHGVARMLRHPEGARRLTNVMHLAELLQQAEADGRLSPTGLAAWFSRRRANARRGDEVAQLRLESDEELVKIVSIHRSKGLEFPIVFLPFAWDARTPAQNKRDRVDAVYHDRTEVDYPEVLHLKPDDAAHRSEWLEDYSDETRLLYVALTRARLRCVVTWGPANQSEHAPLGWLLQPPEPEGADGDVDPESALAIAAAASKDHSAPNWMAALERVAANCPGAIAIEPLSGADAPEPVGPRTPDPVLRARHLERALRRTRQMTSYSALARGTGAAATMPDHETVELPDHDDDAPEAAAEGEGTRATPPEAPERTPFTFPSGPRAGNCLHRIFERLDGRRESGADLDALCRESLAAHGFGVEWAAVARTMVENTRRVRLVASAGPGAGAGFRLDDLARPISEMEFHLPVHRLDRRRLGATLAAHGHGDPLAGADSRPIEGFLRGFIDLVAMHDGCWYVVDYKSNLLGPSPDSYAAEGLGGAMARGGYRLQYLLYVLALHRYLSARQPGYDYESHVGGAFYLFLRGVDPAAGMDRGVFFDRPSAACIAALDACLAEEGT